MDVYAAANTKLPDELHADDLLEKPVQFATNEFVLAAPEDTEIDSIDDLTKEGTTVVVGSESVPIGAYTRQLLRRMQLSSILNTNTVSLEPNVNSIVAKVGLGSADAGFAYFSDWKAAASRLNRINLPKWAQPPVRYQMCAVRRPGADTASANRFMRRVLASRGRAVLKRFGFGTPPRG